MKRFFLFIAVNITLITVIGCNNSKKTADDKVFEKLYTLQWVFTEVKGVPVPLSSAANILFTDAGSKKVSGNTGCNRMNGSFELSNTNTIKFSPLAVTKMACLNSDANTLESKILEVLSATDSYNLNGDELVLSKGSVAEAKLKGVKPLSDSVKKLNGTWELTIISDTIIDFNKLFPAKKPTLIFNLPNPEISGNGSCNGYSAPIKIDGNKINFGDPLSTMMACEGGGEPVFFSSLKKVTSYSITNQTTLTLFKDTIEVLRFTKK
jgi:heat shock protein HslJ